MWYSIVSVPDHCLFLHYSFIDHFLTRFQKILSSLCFPKLSLKSVKLDEKSHAKMHFSDR